MILAIVQARMSSTRLPGKVLLPLLGEPMLARQVERLRRAQSIDQLLIATTADPWDDLIASVAAELSVESSRGSVDDVLDRFYQAAVPHRPSHIVRLTADCPLADWSLVDRAVQIAVGENYHYVSTALHETWPDGLDAEVMTFAALETAWREARSPVEREHVTPYIVNRAERFRQSSVDSPVDLSAMRWTVDEPRDFAFVSAIYEALYPANPAFTTEDVLILLRERPELMEINRGIERNEGLRRSVEKHSPEASDG
jgi:spore coat polysaccharide biosynthesis protein SpsF